MISLKLPGDKRELMIIGIAGMILLLGIIIVISPKIFSTPGTTNIPFYQTTPSYQGTGKSPFAPTITPIANTTVVSSGPTITPLGSFPSTWKMDEDPAYAVAYPADWHTESLPVKGKNLYIAVVPNTSTDDDIFPRLDILFYSSSATSVQALINKEMSVYNQITKPGSLQQTYIHFQGVSASQVSAIIQGSAYVKGNPQHKDVIKAFIAFQKGQKIYLIDDAYYNDENADANRQLLLQILSTMNFP